MPDQLYLLRRVSTRFGARSELRAENTDCARPIATTMATVRLIQLWAPSIENKLAMISDATIPANMTTQAATNIEAAGEPVCFGALSQNSNGSVWDHDVSAWPARLRCTQSPL